MFIHALIVGNYINEHCDRIIGLFIINDYFLRVYFFLYRYKNGKAKREQ